MLVATFGPSAEWAGKAVSYEDGRFTLEDFGPITPRAVLDYDREGQLLWASEETRAWVHGLITVTAPSPAAAVAPKKGLSKGVRIALALGIVLVVAIVVATAVLNTGSETSTPSISSSEMHHRLAGQVHGGVVVDSCRISDGRADVVLKDPSTDSPSEFDAVAQQDCFDAFRTLFAPGTGVTQATVEVMIEASDQFGFGVWDPIYKASLAGDVAAKVDWETASAAEVKPLWTVDFRKDYMAP
jgi:hypothetical protein